MEFKILDGRTMFYQWDLKQYLILQGFTNVEQVHFEDSRNTEALVSETFNLNGNTLVRVPDASLRAGGSIKVYAYDIDNTTGTTGGGSRTLYEQRFVVERRAKPSDYIQDDPDVIHLSDLITQTQNFINNSVNNQLNVAKASLLSYEGTQEQTLQAFTETKKNDIQAKVNTFSDYSQIQTRLQVLENRKTLYFDDNGYINYKD